MAIEHWVPVKCKTKSVETKSAETKPTEKKLNLPKRNLTKQIVEPNSNHDNKKK